MIRYIEFVLWTFIGSFFAVTVFGSALFLIRTPVAPKQGWKMALTLALSIISFSCAFWAIS